ncbi:MAG: hypothetical protein ACTSQI_08850 [Candidatus Helarchaeota archaeon]
MHASQREELIKKTEAIMKDCISEINFKWSSNVFTSSTITKIILKKLELPKTQFRIIHRIVRDIFKKWEEKSYCEHIETTHYAHCKKTKMIIQFNRYGFRNIVEVVFPLPI